MQKIVIVGDSVAAGFYHGEITHLLDDYILETLTDMGFPDFEVVNLGEKGASTESCLATIPKAVAEKPDFVVFNIGINDAVNVRDNLPAYRANLEEMMSHFKPEQILLLGPSYVDTSIKTQTDQVTIQEYNTAAKGIAINYGAKFIDVYHHMTVYPAPNEFLQDDGLHPSKFGYHLLGSLIARDIKNKLIG